MPLALSTGHMVGLGVTAAAFIAFALASSFLFPRFRPNYPGRGLPAFIVVSLVFFVAMLSAVETFGAEGAGAGSKRRRRRRRPSRSRRRRESEPTTTEAQETTTEAETTTTAPTPQASTEDVTETEFKIALASTELKAGKITFDVTNNGASRTTSQSSASGRRPKRFRARAARSSRSR